MEIFLIGILILIIVQVILKKSIKKWHIGRAGRRGEKKTYILIKKLVKKNKGILIRNVKLPLYNESTEIDLLIISSQGIMCIENKHVSGNITGRVKDTYWQQIKSNDSKKMYNPIKQNNGHIKCLRHHLTKNNIKGMPIFGYVVFSNQNAKIHVKDNNIGTIKDFIRYLKKVYFKSQGSWNRDKVYNIIKKIKL